MSIVIPTGLASSVGGLNEVKFLAWLSNLSISLVLGDVIPRLSFESAAMADGTVVSSGNLISWLSLPPSLPAGS